MFIYVGCYTLPPMGSGVARGISLYRFDPETGESIFVKSTVGIPNPSFLATDSEKRFLFACNELDEGAISAFSRDAATGHLKFLNRQSSRGIWPCHLSVDPTDRFVLAANYGSGSVVALPIALDGKIGPASAFVQHLGSSVHERQNEPHAHMIAASPDGKYILASDLGIDRIIVYRLNAATGALERQGEIEIAPGAGPRHFAFSSDGKSLYVLNEIGSSLTAYDYDANTGGARSRQTISALPADFQGESTCAQIGLSPDGRFLYASNRGHDSIVICAIDQPSGALSVVGHEPTQGKTPRSFAIDPTGRWLLVANQESDTIVTFLRDAGSGRLSASGKAIATANPVSLLFVCD